MNSFWTQLCYLHYFLGLSTCHFLIFFNCSYPLHVSSFCDVKMCGICHLDVLDKIWKASLTQGLILDTVVPSYMLFRRQHKSQCLFITTISPFAWVLLQEMYSMSTDLSLDPGFSQECAPVLEAESCWCSEASVVVSVKWAICHLGLGPAIALWNLYSFHCLNICILLLSRDSFSLILDTSLHTKNS